MEFVKGRELKDYFEANERFATADIVRIMTQILDALDYSHRLGVIHRDIKPANVFLLDDGAVKVADFGIAHIESSNMTQAGTVLGTPSYMSPEQIMGLPVDGRSDLFSAGVILYQFLTGERPFAGSATDDDAQGAEGRSAAAVALQRAGARRDGRRRAQGARRSARRALSDRRGVRRRVARRRAEQRSRAAAPRRRRLRRRRCRRDITRREGDAHARAARRGVRRASRRRTPSRRRGRAGEEIADDRPSRSSSASPSSRIGAGAWYADQRARRTTREGGASAGERRCRAAPARRPPARRAPAPPPGCAAREDATRHDDDLRGRPGRSQRSALQRRQGAAAIRPARGRQEPARREGARAHGRSELARQELRPRRATSCCRRAATTLRRSSRKARRASARTASCR